MGLTDNVSSNWKRLKKKNEKVYKVRKPSASDVGTKPKLKKHTFNSIKIKKEMNKKFRKPASQFSAVECQTTFTAKQKKIGQYVAIDAEFVGVGDYGRKSVLARVSAVNYHGYVLYDSFVKPGQRVTDWRTEVSGVTPYDMKNAVDFDTAQDKISELLNGRVLVGHAVHNDLKALKLRHPKSMTRDTSTLPYFREICNGRMPSLKKLAKEILDRDIQGGEHSSVEDAIATMEIFREYKDDFETKRGSLYI